MRVSTLRNGVIGLMCLATVSLGMNGAAADHVLEAEHAPRALVINGEAMEVSVPVGTSCAIAYLCSWVMATVLYTLPDGEPAEAWVEGPYQPFQVLVVTIPTEHIVGSRFSYRIEVSQQSCFSECHELVVHLPRMLDAYTVEVVDV